MKKFETLVDIKEAAIIICSTMVVRYPLYNKTETLDFDNSGLKKNTYWQNNGVIAFFDGEKKYVIPYFPEIHRILEQNGYTEDGMGVPFSNGEYPVAYESKWNDLKRLSHERA